VSHGTRIQAISVGHALDVDSAGFGAVHSVFTHAVNLTMRGDMWTLLAEGKTDLPLGIRLALANFHALGLHSGDVVSVRAGFVGIGSRLIVDCRAPARWLPVRPETLKPGLNSRLAILAKAACDKSWRDSARMARDVLAALSGATALGDTLAKVVGRGPGATPAGDDVLVGILAVLTAPHSGLAGARAAVSLGRALLPLLPTTTEVSGHLLRQATKGLFGRDLHEMVGALIGASSPRQLNEKVRRVIETGATSGADACEGLLVFAPSYFASGNERVSA
jgi:Protein of unknown function (DUF2877)